MATFGHVLRTRPQFIAYAVHDLPAAIPWVARSLFHLPLLTWTVRTEEERRRGLRFADQIIFEGIRP
jgi:glycerophosphoryl diester phosphodiesterase